MVALGLALAGARDGVSYLLRAVSGKLSVAPDHSRSIAWQ